MFDSTPTFIQKTVCIDNSRILLNKNFKSVQENVIKTETYNNQITKEYNIKKENIINKINNINNSLIQLVCNIKMYVDNTDNKHFFIKPYNGSGLYLYSIKDARWIYRSIANLPDGVRFDISYLDADSSYDIFLSFNEDTRSYQVKFDKWSDIDQGYCKKSLNNNIVLLNNIKVHKDFLNYRYLGCLRTTYIGTTESTLYGSDLAGTHIKQFLWNYYNREEKVITNKITGFYKNLYTYTQNKNITNAMFNTSYINEKDKNSSGSCFSFIIGDFTEVQIKYVNYFNNLDINTTVYSLITINDILDIDSQYGCLMIGLKTLKEKESYSSTSSSFRAVLPPGLYKIQTHDACTNDVIFNKNYDTTLKTGFIGSIVN